jgi:hypothetical protein
LPEKMLWWIRSPADGHYLRVRLAVTGVAIVLLACGAVWGLAGASNSPDDAPGLAWRALALHRLNRDVESAECFAQAEQAGRTLTPQTWTWREWFDVATAAALAGDWRRACAAAEAPGSEDTRFNLRCHVLQLWAYHDHPQVRW